MKTVLLGALAALPLWALAHDGHGMVACKKPDEMEHASGEAPRGRIRQDRRDDQETHLFPSTQSVTKHGRSWGGQPLDVFA